MPHYLRRHSLLYTVPDAPVPSPLIVDSSGGIIVLQKKLRRQLEIYGKSTALVVTLVSTVDTIVSNVYCVILVIIDKE